MSFAAKQGDKVIGKDTHIVLVPSPGGPVPTPTPLPFVGTITDSCSTNVMVGGVGAATVGSMATNAPAHIPPSGSFANPPTNKGTVFKGSKSVLINGKPAARNGDTVMTCSDPIPAPNGKIIAVGTVIIGG